MELKELRQETGSSVICVVARQNEAIAAAEDRELGLVLADIQLEDYDSGIDAAQAILQPYEMPILFVTGFLQRLLISDGL